MMRSVISYKLQVAGSKFGRFRMLDAGSLVQGKKQFYLLTTIFYILFLSAVHAQEIRVRAKFNGDSVKIGKPIEFYLAAHYPENLNVLFPDSSFSFAPFEFQKKIYFPTQTKNGVSKDSVVYTFASYEVDSIQTLKLPVYVVNKMDCTQVFSNTDSVYFQNLVKAIPDSLTTEKLPLKVNTNYLGVRWQLNYVLLGIAGGILLIVLVLVWIIFGKRIQKYFRLKRMSKNYEAFRVKFENSVEKLDNDFSPKSVEASLFIWKNYLETLLSKPYTKYTSKEIKTIENSEELGHALSEIDRMIYGHERGNPHAPFAGLKAYVHQQFEKKKEEVAHG